MNKQKTVDSKVLAILRECPETRYDDMQLILCYYNRYSYMRVGDLPLEDIQHILKVSRTTVYELLKSKKFHSVRVGGQYRISKKSFENWLNGEKGGSEDGIC